MIPSSIQKRNGEPALIIDGREISAAAYTTYFGERARYEDFVKAGYRIFFVNVSMTLCPINSATGFTPFDVGVFENPKHPDYSEFEGEVRRILTLCPDAYIFPRIYISMPKWWCDAHPEETVATLRGGQREMLFSDAFRRDGEAMLRQMIRHILASEYGHRVTGWQLCGGWTQEWFHHDGGFGSLCENAAPYYRRWMEETYGVEHAVLPDKDCYRGEGKVVCSDENARRYAEFANLTVAETLDGFARAAKEETGFSQIVGVFYGYSLSTREPLRGSHGLRSVIDSPYLDFFSSPNCYTNARPFGIDWSDMMAVDTVKRHGKLCFIECDIRTYLTEGIQESRPGRYPTDIYPVAEKGKPSVWAGPPTAEWSREALRKCFAHQITKGSGIWWFDMWGGWYDDPLLMETLADMKRIQDEQMTGERIGFPTEVAFFADERAYANLYQDHETISRSVHYTRIAMGNVGAPYASYMVEEGKEVLTDIRAAIFPAPVPSAAGERMMRLCQEKKIPTLSATVEHPSFSSEEIQAFLRNAGVHLYSETDDVVYVGNGYLGLHAKNGGEKRIFLPGVCRVMPLFGADIPKQVTDTMILPMEQYQTVLFKLTNA